MAKTNNLIQATGCIVIVDDAKTWMTRALEDRGKSPQRDESTLHLAFSATLADKHHMLYRLDAVDAYERKLVKQIEVASLDHRAGHANVCEAAGDEKSARDHYAGSNWMCSMAPVFSAIHDGAG